MARVICTRSPSFMLYFKKTKTKQNLRLLHFTTLQLSFTILKSFSELQKINHLFKTIYCVSSTGYTAVNSPCFPRARGLVGRDKLHTHTRTHARMHAMSGGDKYHKKLELV